LGEGSQGDWKEASMASSEEKKNSGNIGGDRKALLGENALIKMMILMVGTMIVKS